MIEISGAAAPALAPSVQSVLPRLGSRLYSIHVQGQGHVSGLDLLGRIGTPLGC